MAQHGQDPLKDERVIFAGFMAGFEGRDSHFYVILGEEEFWFPWLTLGENEAGGQAVRENLFLRTSSLL